MICDVDALGCVLCKFGLLGIGVIASNDDCICGSGRGVKFSCVVSCCGGVVAMFSGDCMPESAAGECPVYCSTQG